MKPQFYPTLAVIRRSNVLFDVLRLDEPTRAFLWVANLQFLSDRTDATITGGALTDAERDAIRLFDLETLGVGRTAQILVKEQR